MKNDDRSSGPMSASRRLFLQRTSLLTGMIALGGGSYLYNPKGVWAADPIKVGIATDLTGAISWGGIPCSQVAKMTIDQINNGGGLLGRPLQMILEDTATNEQLAVTKVRKLVTQDRVDVVFGGITSSMRNAIKDTIVNRGRTLYIYPQLYEGKECTPYLFCTGPTPAQQCDTFIPWLIKNGGKKQATGIRAFWRIRLQPRQHITAWVLGQATRGKDNDDFRNNKSHDSRD